MENKGKLEIFHRSTRDELWIGADNFIASVYGNSVQRQSRAEHIAKCWNGWDELVEENNLLKATLDKLEHVSLQEHSGNVAINELVKQRDTASNDARYYEGQLKIARKQRDELIKECKKFLEWYDTQFKYGTIGQLHVSGIKQLIKNAKG